MKKIMRDEELLRKAGQIAAQFAPYPEPEAIAGIAEHIKKFWTPSMREQLADHISQGGKGLPEVFRKI